MVQFLSINFFSWISSIFVGFLKSPRFFVSSCIYEYCSPYSSSSMAVQPNLGLGLFNPPPPAISILCTPSPVPALQYTLTLPCPLQLTVSFWAFQLLFFRIYEYYFHAMIQVQVLKKISFQGALICRLSGSSASIFNGQAVS